MRKTLILAFGLVVDGASAQCPALDTAAVVTVDSVSAADLHARARKWFAITFVDSKEVIQLDDVATFTIVGKGASKFDERGQFRFTMEVACKEGRYRAEIRDLTHEGLGGDMVGRKYWPSVSLGAMYDCSVCCENHKAWLEKNPTKGDHNARVCVERLIPLARTTMGDLLASLQRSMTAPAKDW